MSDNHNEHQAVGVDSNLDLGAVFLQLSEIGVADDQKTLLKVKIVVIVISDGKPYGYRPFAEVLDQGRRKLLSS